MLCAGFEIYWFQVYSKKKRHASNKELPIVKTKEGAFAAPKQNFEDLIKKCQETFPGVPKYEIYIT